VVFTGMVEPREVYKYYQIAHLFVTASTSETQGLTYIEALSSGCPIVCKYDKSVEGVVLQGRNGFLYKNPWEFTLFTSEILLDRDLRGELSERAKNKAFEYSSDTFADNVINLYRKTISCSYQTQGKRSTSSMMC
jgi:1,2-diacylglycerol 3-alpha-glucosyltransferase